MSHLFEDPLVVVFFLPFRYTELKNDQETPSERMNNHFIEMLKACSVESCFFFILLQKIKLSFI